MGTTFKDDDPMMCMGPFAVQRSEKSDQSGANDDQMRFRTKDLLLPKAMHDRCALSASARPGYGSKIDVICPAGSRSQRSIMPSRSVAHPCERVPRSFLAALGLCIAGLVAAQEQQLDNVYVYGTVKDQYTAKKLEDVVVTIYKNGGKLQEVSSNASGKYEFTLDYGADYKIVYSRIGWVSKNYTVDTRNVPEEQRVGGEGMNVEMTLFQELPGMDFSILQQPIGKAKYSAEKTGLDWDWDYTASVQNEVNRLIKEYNDRMKNEANADAQYAKLMQQGDAAMTAKEYNKAVEHFTAALALKPGDAKATARLSDARMMLDDIEAQKKKNEQYAALIKEGDALIVKKEYENAKAKFVLALDLKDEVYPKQKIKELDVLIADAAKRAEEERKAKELEEKYRTAIANGDAAFKAEKYEDARVQYTQASSLKPAEAYPKDQLALITKKLEELAKKQEEERKKKELDAKYQAAIIAADAAFKAANYGPAGEKYSEASGLKPEEKYPKDQLALIAKKLEELAKKAEEDRKLKELEDQYKAAIAAADGAFKSERYDEAKAKYSEALALKPQEKYPKDQLAAIDRKLAELARKAEEDAKLQALNERYQAAITAADAAFAAAKWDDAKVKYNDALGIKPAEKYPKDQLLAIDKALADAVKLAEEDRLRKERDERYSKLIEAGDQMFRTENYEGARTKFSDAITVKPDETYPRDKVKEIDLKIADLKRSAEEEKLRKEREAQYASLIAAADKAYGGKKYSDALNAYRDASGLKPDEGYPKERIALIESQMGEEARAKAEKERIEREKREFEERYAGLIRTADQAFGEERYEDARGGYTEALAMKPEERHPKSRLAEIDKLLAEMARKAEEDRLKAEREADEQARLAAERQRKDMEAAELEARYRQLIADADLAFNQEKLDAARNSYTDALAMKPGERYPQDRLAEIERLIAQRAADAEAARLAEEDQRRQLEEDKALDERYRGVILQADEAMAGENYTGARGLYTQALDIKPQEIYPQAKIEQIDKLLAEEERKRREAELAAQARKEERRRPPGRVVTREEEEAERFMREAREREEQEKYALILKQRRDVSDTERANADKAAERREGSMQEGARLMDAGAGLFQGSEEARIANAEAIEAQKEALAEAERERQDRSAASRSAAHDEQLGVQEEIAQTQAGWNERNAQNARQAVEEKGSIQARQQQLISAAQGRVEGSRAQSVDAAEQMARMQERGNQLAGENHGRVLDDKRALQNREAQMSHRSEDRRLDEQERLARTPVNQPKGYADYNRSSLAQQYPEGVTEESYTEGNKVVIRRIVVQGNKADEYSKVIAKFGTTFFKNGLPISQQVWSMETEGE